MYISTRLHSAIFLATHCSRPVDGFVGLLPFRARFCFHASWRSAGRGQQFSAVRCPTNNPVFLGNLATFDGARRESSGPYHSSKHLSCLSNSQNFCFFAGIPLHKLHIISTHPFSERNLAWYAKCESLNLLVHLACLRSTTWQIVRCKHQWLDWRKNVLFHIVSGLIFSGSEKFEISRALTS